MQLDFLINLMYITHKYEKKKWRNGLLSICGLSAYRDIETTFVTKMKFKLGYCDCCG